jgi:hypothetical protein
VFSLSAIDLFASAMGAFIVITIILMPDYQKEIRLEGHLAYIEELASESEITLDESMQGMQDLRDALKAALVSYQDLQAEQEIISSELDIEESRFQAIQDFAAPPPPTPEVSDEEWNSHLVTFRFLGLKTEKTSFLFMVDMNRYLAPHGLLMKETLRRALDSLQAGQEFAVLGFQQLDSGPRYHIWPESGELAVKDRNNHSRALRFFDRLSNEFKGSSSFSSAFEKAFESPAEAIILFSDGLPNPAFNDGLPPTALINSITVGNASSKEIHTVTIGDYFKYRGTVDFMQALARANAGGFLALAQ